MYIEKKIPNLLLVLSFTDVEEVVYQDSKDFLRMKVSSAGDLSL